MNGMISPEQCRGARALLDWSQEYLAEKAGVGVVTIRQLEAGVHEPRRATLDVIKRAFETAGVDFISENGGGPGVRLRTPKNRRHEQR
jgi:predicted transcriptional regulator